jgi:hypothetical protein
MASRLLASCSRFCELIARRHSGVDLRAAQTVTALMLLCCLPATSQFIMKPPNPGDRITPMPSDVAIFESPEMRSEIPCTVTEHKPELGFDLRFHSGYVATVPLNELAGPGEFLTIVFRVFSEGDKAHSSYFVQHFQVPSIQEDAKGDAVLQGMFDIGEGNYHVDWLMRDRMERICSSNWDIEAALTAKDKPMTLFIAPNTIAQTAVEPFVNETGGRPIHPSEDSLNVKLLVNFAPQNSLSAALQRSDTDALVSILKTIERDPRIAHLSLVAFNIGEDRVIYRQDTAEQIDFPALGKALESMKLGTVNVLKLAEKHSDTDFLQSLIEQEIGGKSHPDAVIFAGPKALLDADVPQDDLRRIGDVECPVFYMNYNLNPQAVPWKDSISHAIRAFKGTEYTISRPRDLWTSTSEMVSRIVRSKRDRALSSASVSAAGTR